MSRTDELLQKCRCYGSNPPKYKEIPIATDEVTLQLIHGKEVMENEDKAMVDTRYCPGSGIRSKIAVENQYASLTSQS